VWGFYIDLAPHHSVCDVDPGRDGFGAGCCGGRIRSGSPSYLTDGVVSRDDRVTFHTIGCIFLAVASSVTFPAPYAYDPDDTCCL
jgi:hypothetical protein